MVNSGTGHDRCPSQVSRTHQAPGSHLAVATWKIKKPDFGFKRESENFFTIRLTAGCGRPRR